LAVIPGPTFAEGYGPLVDGEYTLPGIPDDYTLGINRRMFGGYLGEQEPGTIDVDPYAKFLYNVKVDGSAVRYPVGVGRQGRSISGGATIKLKREWPGWSGSAGCIRMFNHDIIHLFEEVDVPTKVHIRTREESLRVDPENYERGIELPPKILSPEEVFGTADAGLDDLDVFVE